ncbi:MAG TPA: VOC family protein [Gammaproteobacteria bacterium]|nr:VOC family protein [Gammaproteobacteria bacterium]
MNRPDPTAGMRHVALYVNQFEACEKFYVTLLGMQVEWRPDPDNVYLSSGNDNLALHRSDKEFTGPQHLDHIGFIVKTPEQVTVWHEFLLDHQVTMRSGVKNHRDGACSFYCEDPDGNIVQMIYHPPLAGKQ